METANREALYRHGGDLDAARLAFPDAPEPWIDLSTGINPVAYPLAPLAEDIWRRLPHPSELEALQSVAAVRYGCQARNVVAGAGAEALIQLLPRLFPARRVSILGPTYSGHATAWRAAGAEVETIATVGELSGASVAVIVNPNNPDGRRLPRGELASLSPDFARRGGLLIVDEAFADFDDDGLSRDPPPAAIVLRSFGKTFGLAGVRLGFAIAEPERAERIREALGPWPVSGPALAIARRALADDNWLAETKARLIADARWLDRLLVESGFEILGGTLLFRLARRVDAPACFERLCADGILTRPFAARPDWLRFGPPKPGDRARIEAALKALA